MPISVGFFAAISSDIALTTGDRYASIVKRPVIHLEVRTGFPADPRDFASRNRVSHPDPSSARRCGWTMHTVVRPAWRLPRRWRIRQHAESGHAPDQASFLAMRR